jgi:N-acetylmuramoyl-L-alanine amidase
VAIRVAAILKADGIGVVLTKKSRTSFVTNRQRAEIANKAGAAMFIRLHCDYGSSRGFTWYYPAHSGRKDGVTGPPPAICAQSGELAHELNASMAAELTGKLRGNPVKTDAATAVGSKQGGVLTGSIFSRVPTALIEMCTINQPIDAAFIASTDGQEAMATAIAHAIERALPAHPA